ncbi:hypothetical protein DRN93_03945 [archaeon]|nr:MAG: hypothetical protein DRN93_03945 [archaeon]
MAEKNEGLSIILPSGKTIFEEIGDEKIETLLEQAVEKCLDDADVVDVDVLENGDIIAKIEGPCFTKPIELKVGEKVGEAYYKLTLEDIAKVTKRQRPKLAKKVFAKISGLLELDMVEHEPIKFQGGE